MSRRHLLSQQYQCTFCLLQVMHRGAKPQRLSVVEKHRLLVGSTFAVLVEGEDLVVCLPSACEIGKQQLQDLDPREMHA